MSQISALFIDAYRELNHRRLFWITLGLSLIAVAAFAAIGNDEEGLTVLHWSIPFPFLSTSFIPSADFYKFIFAQLGVGYWLGWIASIIALVSTASIFPDFVDRGSIDLMLSKPIGRARLFLTKFATGLLFAGLQVLVFTVASFMVIGIRGGDWEPWLFVAIPIVLVFYSYLFAVQAVIGLLTRSVIASIIGVLLFWMLLFLVQTGDGATLAWRVTQEITTERRADRLDRLQAISVEAEDERLRLVELAADGDAFAEQDVLQATDESDLLAARFLAVQEEQADELATLETARTVNDWFHLANTVLPKTGETIDMLSRILRDQAGLVIPTGEDGDETVRRFGEMVGPREFNERLTAAQDESHSYAWVLTTSLGFEALVLGFGVWRFSRRDY
ncbi:MAG: hypothetical protein CMJ23_12720 [Phycisphaerae bacterium]|nr:hypothetical protein [Phycisphaerae bacterium]